MSKKRENKFLSFIVVIVLMVFVGAIYIVLSSGNLYQNTSNNQQTSSQVYKSKTLKFSIIIPSKFQAEERFTTILLKSSDGEIQINRNGTNFVNVEDYLNNLSAKNRIVIEDKEDLTINDLKTLKATITYPGGPKNGERTYYIYNNDYAIYSLFTSSGDLFDDLDKIAQSFKYTP